MQSSKDVIITADIRAEYAKLYIHDETTIRCFEYVKAQSSDKLKTLIAYNSRGRLKTKLPELHAFAKELSPDGGYININWIINQVGSELYTRDEMFEDDWIELQEKIS